MLIWKYIAFLLNGLFLFDFRLAGCSPSGRSRESSARGLLKAGHRISSRTKPYTKREKLGSSVDSVLPSAFVNVSACSFSFDFDSIVLYIMYASLRALFIGWVLLNGKKKTRLSPCVYTCT